MALNACLIIKDNKILVLREGNIWDLPSVEIDDHDKTEIFLKKHIKENLGITVDIIQIFNTYQILNNDKNVNVNVYEASLTNGKLTPKNGEASFFSIDDLNKFETSATLKLVIGDL